ncbi:MAG: CDP-alcohol phosphatidyltransferase family protein [Propionibacteriaceae bacterium]|nr:CDP-alcohol phosphatidyltransferase family protein [Propionibacteriaceae bacterium]
MSTPGTPDPDERSLRREVPQRSTNWAKRLAGLLRALRFTPNGISIASVAFAALGCAAFVASGFAAASGEDALRATWLVVAALCAPLRLLCNMLDGMLAVEGSLSSPTGDLYNEVPDRVSDVLFLAGAGYAATLVPGAVTVGWVAATLAVLTAYVRSLGAAQGLSNHFEGPMAKPRRMWVLVVGALLSLFEPMVLVPLGLPRGTVLVAALVVVALGSVATVIVRLTLIARDLNARSPQA